MSKKYNDSNGIGITGILLFLILGIFIGIFFSKVFEKEPDEDISVLREHGYQYISPLLDADFNPQTNRSELLSLRSDLNEYISESVSNGRVDDVAVYYKDLNTGAWIGINEKEEYTPASMLKVALMITYFKLAEGDPNLLQQEIFFEKHKEGVDQNIPVELRLEEGYSYTIFELIDRMIVYSDNESLYLLADNLDNVDAKKIYDDLAISIPDDDSVDNFISAKDYSGFFRILYNSSYLSREYSSMALSMLTRTTFEQGLRASIPLEVEIAHKFGERGYVNKEEKQMHDCGIVYHPDNPYILCIMTKGHNFNQLEYTLQSISNLVYERVGD